MADQDPTGRDRAPRVTQSPARDDARTEAAVLGLLLAEHPAQLTVKEISLALYGEAADFRHADAVERAVGELVGAGLLRRSGGLVSVSRAARYFAALELARWRPARRWPGASA
jgi:hypothetical protein